MRLKWCNLAEAKPISSTQHYWAVHWCIYPTLFRKENSFWWKDTDTNIKRNKGKHIPWKVCSKPISILSNLNWKLILNSSKHCFKYQTYACDYIDKDNEVCKTRIHNSNTEETARGLLPKNHLDLGRSVRELSSSKLTTYPQRITNSSGKRKNRTSKAGTAAIS